MSDNSDKSYKSNSFWIPVAIIIAGALVAAAVVYSNKVDNSEVAENLQGAAEEALPEEEPEVLEPGSEVVEVSSDDDPTYGPKDAKVKIIEFSDFECSFCARNVATMNKIKEEYKDKISITFRDYPLDFHQNAKNSALAAQCAFDQDKFWDYHELLFRNQEKLDIGNLKNFAKELKLDSEKFNKCLEDKQFEDEIEKDIADGVDAGVTGTPATFINGRKVVGAQPYEIFKKIIDEELAK